MRHIFLPPVWAFLLQWLVLIDPFLAGMHRLALWKSAATLLFVTVRDQVLHFLMWTGSLGPDAESRPFIRTSVEWMVAYVVKFGFLSSMGKHTCAWCVGSDSCVGFSMLMFLASPWQCILVNRKHTYYNICSKDSWPAYVLSSFLNASFRFEVTFYNDHCSV